MKKQILKFFALVVSLAGFSAVAQADEAGISQENSSEFSVEEQNFAASLDEQTQQIFSQLNVEQRKKAIEAASKMNANKAVQVVAQAGSTQAK